MFYSFTELPRSSTSYTVAESGTQRARTHHSYSRRDVYNCWNFKVGNMYKYILNWRLSISDEIFFHSLTVFFSPNFRRWIRRGTWGYVHSWHTLTLILHIPREAAKT
jgi:hypothetical protein